MLERDIVEEIRIALGREPDLKIHRISNARHAEWNQNVGGERWFQSGLVGAPDLLGVLRIQWVRLADQPGLHPLTVPFGRTFGLEVKQRRGTHLESQKRWRDAHVPMGAFIATARSVEEAVAALERARRGEAC